MMQSGFRKTAFVIILAVSQLALHATAEEVTRTWEKLFPLTGTASLEVSNRYGSIDIRNWEKNEISVHVLVKVSHSSRETAERQLSYINIYLSQQDNAVKAVTEIDQRIGRSGSRWFSSGSDDTSINIEYTVYAPVETDLNISHRYGDVFIDEARGHTLIDLRYGNLQANRIIRDNSRPLSEVNLAYSPKASIAEADWLKVNMRYSDLAVEECRALVVTASYSKLRVDRASSIVTESRYGEYNLGDIGNFIAESSYTNYSIGNIGKTLDIQSRYGNVRVRSIPADFSKLRFVSSYSNMRVGIDPDASYRIESSTSYGDVSIPQPNSVNRISSGRQSTLSGTVGTEENPRATVEISSRYGNINLRSR